MATEVEAANIEAGKRLAILKPRLFGLHDLAQHKVGTEEGDMTPQAHEQVVQSIARHDKRIKLIVAFQNAGTALLADGYPEMPPTVLDAATLTSIRENAATVALAADSFVGEEPEPMARGLHPVAGKIEPKP